MPEPGAEWAGFRIEERIGASDFSQVFAAWDATGDRRVAIKVIGDDADAAATGRFARESRMAGALDHPRIVSIHRVAEHEGSTYLVMAHIGGGDLAQEIHVAPLTLDRTRSVVGQIGGALDRAHRAGLVHRSVEPANVLCVEDGDDVFLTDFGAPEAGVHYAAPELIRGEVLTPATDVYGLGCLLFECLTGRVPFRGETPGEVTAHHLDSPPPKVTELRPDLSVELDDIVARAMAKDPADRYPSTRHLAEAVALVRPGDAATLGSTAVAPAAFEETTATPEVIADPDPATTSRSVFDDTAAAPAAASTTISEPAPLDEDDAPDDDEVDGAAFGIYEEERRRSRVPAIVVTLLVLATVGVGALVWRAINTDAELGTGASTTTTTSPDRTVFEPTVAALRALVPKGIDTCVEPTGDDADAVPIVFLCPLDGIPEAMSLELHGSDAVRDERFDAMAAALGISDRDDAECALGRMGRHGYEADGRSGEVVCVEADGRVDFVWTRDDAPVILSAVGVGRFADYEAAWETLAERDDAAFPVDDEKDLLDALPDEYLVDCDRDLTLALDAGGRVAVACRPPDTAPSVISWVLFDDGAPMDQWIDDRRTSLDGNNFDTTSDGCDPTGFGQVDSVEEASDPQEGAPEEGQAPPVAGPPPDAAFLDYDLDGSSGKVLCFVNTGGVNAVFWTRDGSRIGSIAVSERDDGGSMIELLRWWRDGGHRP